MRCGHSASNLATGCRSGCPSQVLYNHRDAGFIAIELSRKDSPSKPSSRSGVPERSMHFPSSSTSVWGGIITMPTGTMRRSSSTDYARAKSQSLADTRHFGDGLRRKTAIFRRHRRIQQRIGSSRQPPLCFGRPRARVCLIGKAREAQQVLNELESTAKQHYVPAVYLAAIFAAMGDKTRSIQWMSKAHDERSVTTAPRV